MVGQTTDIKNHCLSTRKYTSINSLPLSAVFSRWGMFNDKSCEFLLQIEQEIEWQTPSENIQLVISVREFIPACQCVCVFLLRLHGLFLRVWGGKNEKWLGLAHASPLDFAQCFNPLKLFMLYIVLHQQGGEPHCLRLPVVSEDRHPLLKQGAESRRNETRQESTMCIHCACTICKSWCPACHCTCHVIPIAEGVSTQETV